MMGIENWAISAIMLLLIAVAAGVLYYTAMRSRRAPDLERTGDSIWDTSESEPARSSLF
ncbi:hypothetical protein [Zhihengliuella halotolerans]|nr:hypothetical protein [Zhihengliuella halotolerans]